MEGDYRRRELMTLIFLGGKRLWDVGFPSGWTYNPVICYWEKDGYDSESDGIKSREKFLITNKHLHEIRTV